MDKLAADLFIKVGEWIANKVVDKGFDKVQSRLSQIDEKDTFYKIVKKTSKDLQQRYPNVLGGSIEHFFKHEEVFSELMNLLFVNAKVDLEIIESRFDLSTLPDGFLIEFINNLRNNLHKDSELSVILGNKELYIACLGINDNLENIEKVSLLSLNEIKKIRSILEKKLKDSFEINEFLEKYYDSALNNLSQVNFIGLGIDSSIRQRGRKKLKDIFVKPKFEITSDELDRKKLSKLDSSEYQNIELETLFNLNNHIVIIGNPGGGKSLLVKAVMCSIIKNNFIEFENLTDESIIPFRIELRKYLAYKKDKSQNIIDFIPFMLSNEYSTQSISTDIIRHIFSNKKCLVLFDGLDEIFNISDRISVRNDIENFIRNYSCQYSIVTSRIIGYDEAGLDPDVFIKIKVTKFTKAQINDYLEKWYTIEEVNEFIRKKEIEEFLNKVDNIDSELISNPLLLSLIVILYRNNLKLPESKLEIYKSCTSTLVDKWDVSKNLHVVLDEDVYKRKETILADLAYWQYNELSKRTPNITYEKVRNTVANTIQSKLSLADEYASGTIAESFIEYAEKRSIYFDNNFTHKTFLEYYTAFWIYTNVEKKHKKPERDKIISDHINNPFWHIVLELLLNLIDNEQADNDIIDELILNQLSDPDNSIRFLLNTVGLLNNISISVIENVLKEAIKLITKPDSVEKREGLFFDCLKYFNSNKSRLWLISAFVDVEQSSSSKVNIYRLFLEIASHSNIDRNSLEWPFPKENLDVVFNNSELSFYYFITIDNTFRESKPSEKIILFKEKFGLESIGERVESIFAGGLHISLLLIGIDYSLSFSKEKISEFFDRLTSNDIHDEFILDTVSNEAFPIIWEEDTVLNLLEGINNITNKKLKLSLFLILSTSHYTSVINIKSMVEKNRFILNLDSDKETLYKIINGDTNVESLYKSVGVRYKNK